MLTRKLLYPHEQSPWAPMRWLRRARNYLQWQYRYRRMHFETRHLARTDLDWCANLETYCLFIGYQRSGHSIIGALLDAHPDMLVAHERGVLRLVELGLHRSQIFHLIRESSERDAHTGRAQGEYRYEVPGQWQGRFRTLRVIGDKHGGTSSERLAHKPGLLGQFEVTVGLPVKVVHVVRNPFDNIATFSRKRRVSLDQGANHYFELCAANLRIREQWPAESFHELRHEAFIADPGTHLRHLCELLGVDAPDDYVKACAAIVYPRPNQSRHTVVWPKGCKERIAARMAEFPFLTGYTYD